MVSLDCVMFDVVTNDADVIGVFVNITGIVLNELVCLVIVSSVVNILTVVV